MWRLKYDINDISRLKLSPIGRSRELWQLICFHMWFGGSGRLGTVVQVAFFGISSQLELECIYWKELEPYRAWKLYKFQEQIMKETFDHLRNLHLWRERASGWLVSCLSQFRGWKIHIQVGVWRGHWGLSWIFNGVVFLGVIYREALGSFYCNTFSQPFPVFIAYSCSWRDCTLGEPLIYLGEIIIIYLWF